eukprot:291126-Hanusia_phi.AAC.1
MARVALGQCKDAYVRSERLGDASEVSAGPASREEGAEHVVEAAAARAGHREHGIAVSSRHLVVGDFWKQLDHGEEKDKRRCCLP